MNLYLDTPVNLANKAIVEQLAVTLCNSQIDYGGGKHHSNINGQNIIKAHNWITVLHEICHWTAAEPSERCKENLGLPVHIDTAAEMKYHAEHKALRPNIYIGCIMRKY